MVLQMTRTKADRRQSRVARWQDERSVVVVLLGSAYLDGPELDEPALKGRVVVFKQWSDEWSEDADAFIGDVVEHAPRGAFLMLVGSRHDRRRARWAALGSGFAPFDIVEREAAAA